jgi:hypothetical protein
MVERGVSALEPTGSSFSFSIEADYSAFDVVSDNLVQHRDGFDRNQKPYSVLAPACVANIPHPLITPLPDKPGQGNTK